MKRCKGTSRRGCLVLKNVSYADRLDRLNLITLELRRLHADLIMCYKIVSGNVDLNFDDFFKYSPATVTRGDRYKLFVQRSDGIRTTFFSQRVINFWNFLPAIKYVNFDSVRTFKHSLKCIDFKSFLLQTLQ